ncbi:MAG: DUF438 domain-containing protein [Planctomycetota bacterium]|jgi:DUF438 domain-containing protein
MASTHRSGKTWALAGFLKRINQGENPKLLRKEAKQLVKNVAPEDITAAEQTLIDEGYPSRIVQQLSATFILLGLHNLHREKSGDGLPDNHILQRIMVEHDLARCFLADLNELLDDIANLKYLTDVSSEFRKLCHIVGHLSVTKEHIDREEDVIFPYLRNHAGAGLCQIAQDDHAKIRIDTDNLVALIGSVNHVRFEDFKTWLAVIVRRLSPLMLEHLSYEDELFWPVALVIIDDLKAWQKIKLLCDEIGYCGAHA